MSTPARVSAVLVALPFVAACAPLAHFRPPSALDDHTRFEAGAGVVTLGPRPYVDEPTTAAGQLWASAAALRWLTISGVGAFDTDAAALGVAVLAKPVRTDRVVAGVELEAGYAWSAFSTAASLRAVDDAWLYAAPQLFLRSAPTIAGKWPDEIGFGVPVGVSVGVASWLDLRAEAQVSWSGMDYFNRRLHLGLAGAYQW